CLLDGIEVCTLDVLDNREFQSNTVINLADNHGNLGQAGDLGRAPPAFTSDNFITTTLARPDHNRLDHAMFPDRLSEVCKLRLAEMSTWVACIGSDKCDRHLVIRAYTRRGSVR